MVTSHFRYHARPGEHRTFGLPKPANPAPPPRSAVAGLLAPDSAGGAPAAAQIASAVDGLAAPLEADHGREHCAHRRLRHMADASVTTSKRSFTCRSPTRSGGVSRVTNMTDKTA